MRLNIKSNLLKVALVTMPLVATISSCQKNFLDAVPELSLSDVNAFDTPDRVLAQVNGLYLSAKHGALFGGRYLIYNDIRAEEFLNRTANGVTGYTVYQGTNNSSDTYVGNFWTRGYLTINQINLFLKGLDDNASKIDPALAANYRSEAKFLRAMTYHALVQMFAKPYILDNGASKAIPLRLQPETTLANNDFPKSTVAQVYTQILKDLDEAEAGLPDTYSSALLRTTRAHKNTAIALKTRVYLAKGDYAKVITEGNKIVSAAAPFKSSTGAAHALQANITDVFKAPYTTSESIFSFPMADTNAPGTQNQLGYYFNVGNLEYVINKNAPGIFANAQWGANDIRRTQLTAVHTLGTYPTKFSGVSPYIDFVPQIRYAEVLLNLAEAEAEAGSAIRAVELLKAVHLRSDAAYVFSPTLLLDKPALINAILTERRIELFSEGFRANDILRRGQSINSIGAGSLIAPTDQRYIFPIPVGETDSNKGL
ncbi:MAG TPA: RagB/SusD family nutrient uptake outer membrane protein [Daejeonella sp.]|nr:RagB/SusD family nutrient uptake outer membrane protein [Daejeonella sp.]